MDPPCPITVVRAHIEAQRQMEQHALEAKRLHDAGDLHGARRELAKAERFKGILETDDPAQVYRR